MSSGYGPVVGSCEHGNEPLGSIKGVEFIDRLSKGFCSLLLLLLLWLVGWLISKQASHEPCASKGLDVIIMIKTKIQNYN
jgi:hypothetical protein